MALFSGGNREKNFPEISDAEEGCGGAPSGHSGKNDYTKLEKLWCAGERQRDRKKRGSRGSSAAGREEGRRARAGDCSGDEAAVSRDVTVARSFIAGPFLCRKLLLQRRERYLKRPDSAKLPLIASIKRASMLRNLKSTMISLDIPG